MRRWLPGLALLCALLTLQCQSKSPSAPGSVSSSVTDFLSTVSSSAGGTVSQQSGSPPPPSGGPTAGVVGSGDVVGGGSNAVQVTGSGPFDTVDLSVSTGGGSNAFRLINFFESPASAATAINGFWQLKLPTPGTSLQIVYTLNPNLPVPDNGQFSTVFQLVSANGAVGPPATQVLTKLKSSGVGDPTISLTVTAFNQYSFTLMNRTFAGQSSQNQMDVFTFTNVSPGTYTVSGQLREVINFNVPKPGNGLLPSVAIQRGSFRNLDGPNPVQLDACSVRFTAPCVGVNQCTAGFPFVSFSFQFTVIQADALTPGRCGANN